MTLAVVNRKLQLALLCAAALGACGDEAWNGEVATADAASFETLAYPVLLRDCGFNDCHGGPARFFQIFGPGRTRLDPMIDPAAEALPAEIAISYQRAVSMLQTEGGDAITESLLLKKPLEVKAGGVAHKGIDALGRNVYQSKTDPGYAALLQWAMTSGTGLPPATGGSGGSGGILRE